MSPNFYYVKTGGDVLPGSQVEDTPSPVLQKYSTLK